MLLQFSNYYYKLFPLQTNTLVSKSSLFLCLKDGTYADVSKK